jgi:site-specific DNA-methyltransferase (adenine-specific)
MPYELYNRDFLDIDFHDQQFNVIFADPPYGLSGNGTTCRAGKRTSVRKGNWDATAGRDDFDAAWLSRARDLLLPDGTIWICGTHHNIFRIGELLRYLDLRVLNLITWQKPNPPPNLACRCFTHSTEHIIWAAKTPKSKYFFNYDVAKELNGGKQMKDVWTFTAAGRDEKTRGAHPTQKPLALLDRIIKTSVPSDGHILDPFAGSGTTGVAALRNNVDFTGVEMDPEYFALMSTRVADEYRRQSILPDLVVPERKSPVVKQLEREPCPTCAGHGSIEQHAGPYSYSCTCGDCNGNGKKRG